MKLSVACALVAGVAGCSGSGSGIVQPLPVRAPASTIAVDYLNGGTTSCAVSADGMIWYDVPSGTFAPIVAKSTRCPGAQLDAVGAPVPRWAVPQGHSNAIFTVASLVGSPGAGILGPLESLARQAGTPVTWLVDRPWTDADASIYDIFHGVGDDVQVAPWLVDAARARFSWYRPAVAVLGAGSERDIAATMSAGLSAFWGITWNSSGVDGTADRGAPWGLYCADPTSYKRPDPTGSCPLAAVEWTARDLTAAYEEGHEDAYSTDPEDMRIRAALDPASAAVYARQIADAYAAAGETTPLLMVLHEEAAEVDAALSPDTTILQALYGESLKDGMTAATMPDAITRLRPMANAARAVAFPSLASSGWYGPGTIDAHDGHVALTFRAGETMPDRVFAYDRETHSAFNVPVPQLSATEMPVLVDTKASNGVLSLHFRSPIATRFGVAFWSDPLVMRWTSPNVVPAGRAGAVAFFDLPQGDSTVNLSCGACSATDFPYST